MNEADLSDVMSIERAAREVHMRNSRVKKIAMKNGLLIQWGEKQVRVKLAELRQAILDERCPIPGGRNVGPKRLRAIVPLHPDVRC